MKRKLLIYSLVALIFLAGCWELFLYWIQIDPPAVPIVKEMGQPVKKGENYYTLGKNWIKKSESGLWELYVQGSPYERGIANGRLAKELVEKQEIAFVDQLQRMIPSKTYINFLKYMISWFNRDLPNHVPLEYQQQIYGISQSASSKYEFIGENYDRILNYHAAHDIGHALQNMRFVGCTAFSVWNGRTSDSTMIIGRNFDFYVGDKFAEDKLICFFHPESGYKFMTVAWGAFTGACSGMNEKGLTITLNAAKSEIPSGAATPVSLIATEILQYASTIQEAVAIAQKRKSFVAESFVIGSAIDKKTVVIEKSPSKMDVYDPNSDKLVCTNHFQSAAFAHDSLNVQHIRESASLYRYNRVEELLKSTPKITPQIMATLLRDRAGLKNKDIGMGNENSINQLICHHSIIFQPEKLLVWISTSPYQLGKYVCYDLKKVFALSETLSNPVEITEKNLEIGVDSFMFTREFKNYTVFRSLT
ncbi:MAG: C45 family peptidase, partial [Cytophagales bacterium]|nr:C45 family peptidase [Cytophagales bacterium]